MAEVLSCQLLATPAAGISKLYLIWYEGITNSVLWKAAKYVQVQATEDAAHCILNLFKIISQLYIFKSIINYCGKVK
jgi:hypothetical protein